MRISDIIASAPAAAALAVISIVTAATGSAWWPHDAQGAPIQKFGTQQRLVDGAGTIVQGRTVNDLRRSSDAIPYRVRGRLWEAPATDEAIRGTVTPDHLIGKSPR